MNDPAIEVRNLTKKFGTLTAVDNISLTIQYGEVFGYLGANGAGKSTTMRMLCGILAPSAGEGRVAGCNLIRSPEAIKQAIGYVSQRFSLYEDLTVLENLSFYGQIYGLSGQRLRERITEVLKTVRMDKWQNRMSGTLSGGMKQRVAVANAILHRPKILFLDEPTAGIDPISRRSLWELFYQLAQSGITLFVTTHYMEEAERCQNIAIISRGRVLTQGEPARLKEDIDGDILEITCQPVMAGARAFREIPQVKAVTLYGTNLHLNVEKGADITSRLREAANREHIQIESIRNIDPSLEDLFATIADDPNA
ncbi:MAG: ABC transporter ATP-binding protein [Candidatus Omnitrophica bacterium]|nr:ABC transporter ATP-binding protein [Candidatus Omnitrophota bacterium]